MKKIITAALLALLIALAPSVANCQTVTTDIKSLHAVLEQLYEEMIPLCSSLIGVAQGLAGFAALWYIAARVWRHIANAEPVDFYPLFRPFVLGFCILIFPSVVQLINGVMQPTVSATSSMVNNSNEAIATLLKAKEDAVRQSPVWQMYVGETGSGDREKWYKYTHPDDPDGSNEGVLESLGNDIRFAMAKASYNFRNSVKQWMSEFLQVIFEAASLCIDTLRTFNLIVLAILGPLVFGLAVFDGFQHTLNIWLARYINIFLWLPVANIFGGILGKIQEHMIALDIQQIQQAGDTFFSANDTAYLIFLIIGIVGYFTVPSVANHIVQAGGGNALLFKVTGLLYNSSNTMVRAGSGAISNSFSAANQLSSMLPGGTRENNQKDNPAYPEHNYMRDRISGQ